MSLWLSRLLFARAPGPYDVHGALWRAFPEQACRPFLFRADDVEGGGLRVLVQSSIEPEWARLGDALREVSGPKPYAPNLVEGSRFRFFLRANVTVSRKGRDEPRFAALEPAAFRAKRGLRVGVVRDEERVAWLVRQGKRTGLALASRSDGTLALNVGTPFVTRWRQGGHSARHDGIDFEGVLVVSDAKRFASNAVAEGIGPAKAFGFGMLSLAPA